MMGWEALYRYKLQGTRINYRGEQLYVFDLTSTEIFLPAIKDPDNPKARAKRSAAMYPADWRDSFGIPVCFPSGDLGQEEFHSASAIGGTSFIIGGLFAIGTSSSRSETDEHPSTDKMIPIS